MTESVTPLIMANYGLFIAAVLSLWQQRWPYLWACLLVPGLILALLLGLLEVSGLLVLCGILIACRGLSPSMLAGQEAGSRQQRILHHSSFLIVFIVPLLLLTGVLGGFHNPRLIENVTIGSATTPISVSFSFQASVIALGLLVFAIKPRSIVASDWVPRLRTVIIITTMLIALIMPLAMMLDYIQWDPKWSPVYLYWSVAQLFATCLGEELFFRGLIQSQLALLLKPLKYSGLLAVGISAIIFGLGHGGGTLSALAFIAGLGYGYAYYKTRAIEAAILTHFLFNSCHFLLFSYPRA